MNLLGLAGYLDPHRRVCIRWLQRGRIPEPPAPDVCIHLHCHRLCNHNQRSLCRGEGPVSGRRSDSLAAQALGYFFIAFSHSIKTFDFAPPKYFILIPLAVAGFVIPGNSIEHITRSIPFILLVYVSIETMAHPICRTGGLVP
jgi:hypothetical protein